MELIEECNNILKEAPELSGRNYSFEKGPMPSLELINKRDELAKESWIRNVIRVLGYSRSTAEQYYTKIFCS